MNQSLYYKPNEASQEIRLLQILPVVSDSEKLECQLNSVPLSTAPDFTALSYVWGHVAITKDITVSGQTFAATINLCAALRHLRRQSTLGYSYSNVPCRLWVDAICIDQGNMMERSLQVTRMSGIYSRASRTTIWLGPEPEDSVVAMDTLADLSETISHSYTRMASEPRTGVVTDWTESQTVLPYTQAQIEAICRLYSRA